MDLLQGLGANRSAIAREQVSLIWASTSLHPTVGEYNTLTLILDNHFALSGAVGIELHYGLGY